MDNATNIMILFVKNEKGVAMPIYVKPDDPISLIWSEVGFSTAINEKCLKNKNLYYRGSKMDRTKQVSDYGIHRGEVIDLKND